MVLDSFSLAGQVGIVTGGGQGLGEVFALAFAEAGADVAVVDTNLDTGPCTVAQVEAHGRRAAFFPADVRSKAAVDGMVEAVAAHFGRLDFLMNNAGIVQWGAAEDVTEEDWRRVVDVNLNGLFFCCQAAGRHFMSHGGGRIVNIASMSGFIVNTPQPQASYNASKAAVIHLTRSLAVEWAAHGVRVNAIAPGYMGTSMAQPFFDDPAYGGKWIPAIPLGRPGRPEELGPLAVFLAAEASSYMTGATVVIDGGYTAL
jgi:NAD(P)-dependent dehydrogenase (short-subunit alcohol dehydrogenase family)